MAIRKILTEGDPALTKVCHAVTKFDQKLWDLLDDLKETLEEAHGAGLAAVWGAWSRSVMDAAPERFARFARAVMGVDTPGSDEETALAGIRAFEHFLRSIGMPTTVGQLGITLDEQAIEKLAWMCTFEGRRTIGSFKVLGLEEIKDIYRAAR